MYTSAVVVGGSLSGLIAGLQLKRQGVNVTILEKDVNSERSSHNAGIQVSANVNEFFRQNDDTGLRLALETTGSRWSVRRRQDVATPATVVRHWTNWGYLYRILRANFDGYASKACPDPPDPRPGDGQARYLTGKRVTGLQYDAARGLVTVTFVDPAGAEEQSIAAELVIGADGFHSAVRRLVQAPQAMPDTYAGFFAWRGAIPRRMVSKETADYFVGNASFDLMGNKTYILCYVIPTDHGDFDPDEVLLNWLIYQDLAEGSAEEADIFTDVHGRRCARTVPQGLVRPAVWARHRAALVPRMVAPFAELVERSATPFATKVGEHLGARAASCDGRVVLVGDALAAYRPNLGRATDQAASHCLSLARVWRGSEVAEGPAGAQELATWDRETCFEARRVMLLSRIMSEFGRGTWFSFVASVASYLWFRLRRKLGMGKL